MHPTIQACDLKLHSCLVEFCTLCTKRPSLSHRT